MIEKDEGAPWFPMQTHKGVFQVALVDLRHEVGVILDEILQVVRDGLFIAVRNHDLYVSLSVLVCLIIFDDLCVLHLLLKESLNVSLLLVLEDFLSFALGGVYLQFVTVAKEPLQVFRCLAFEVHSVFDDAYSVPYLLSFFNVLS
jgi:hypothetical protein